jgi:hypothetical protein
MSAVSALIQKICAEARFASGRLRPISFEHSHDGSGSVTTTIAFSSGSGAM